LRLVELSTIKGVLMDLDLYIDQLRSVIKSWTTNPIIIDGNGSVLHGLEVYNALWSLGTKYAPVAESNDETKYKVSLDDLGFYNNVTGRNPRVYMDLMDFLENDNPTPLVKLKYMSKRNSLNVWVKLEWYHPLSLSIKDRIVWHILKNFVERGSLSSGVFYEASSTNTGLGLVSLANYLGFKARIYLPSTAQRCIDYLFKALGAEVVRSNTPITSNLLKRVLEDASRDGALVLNQFENDLNFIVHLKYTAKEIDYQLLSIQRRPKYIVAGLGTSGHLSALAFYFKNKYGDVKVYGVQPTRDSFIPGLRRIETGMKWLKHVELDGILDISIEEAFKTVVEVARREGLLVGLSGGAVLHGVRELIERGELDGDVVAVIPDHGLKYIELLEFLLDKCVEDHKEARD